MNEVKTIMILIGFGIFLWGIIGNNWIKMIGGFLLLTLGVIVESN